MFVPFFPFPTQLRRCFYGALNDVRCRQDVKTVRHFVPAARSGLLACSFCSSERNMMRSIYSSCLLCALSVLCCGFSACVPKLSHHCGGFFPDVILYTDLLLFQNIHRNCSDNCNDAPVHKSLQLGL